MPNTILLLTTVQGNALVQELEQAGYQVQFVPPNDTLPIGQLEPVAAILDSHLAASGGYAICEALRIQPRYIPIIVLAQADPCGLDLMASFAVGADCTLNQQVQPQVLLAQLQALRRMHNALQHQAPSNHWIPIDQALHVNYGLRQIRANSKTVEVSFLELTLLAYFIRNTGRICSRDNLIRAIWGAEPATADLSDAAITKLVARLRAKVESVADGGQYIHTVYGQGYRFVLPRPPTTQ